MKIYTKTGDTGETGLLGGDRVPKDDARIEAYGTVDELASAIGLALAGSLSQPFASALLQIQRDLFAMGAELASPKPSDKGPKIAPDHIQQLERWIDQWEASLPSLRHFILPGGSQSAGFLHLSRSVCRRAERRVVGLARMTTVSPQLVPYLNRLSDLLFVMARCENQRAEIEDVIWQPS